MSEVPTRESMPYQFGSMLDVVNENAEVLKEAIANLGASNLAVFGSVARRDERADSDVDLLVDLEPDTGLFALLRMRSLAEEILGRAVDIVPRSDLKPSIADEVLREAITL